MKIELQLLTDAYLDAYTRQLSIEGGHIFDELALKEQYSRSDFEYYIQASAAYSSNIEGNSIDIDTYLKNKRFNVRSKPKEMAEIDDLIAAYNYAIGKELNITNFLEAHKILSKTILSLKTQRGKVRKQQVGIYSSGKVEYMAVEPEYVQEELKKLFADIKVLIETSLTVTEVLYYAPMIHLMFEKIHPFMDGNGRAGRLLEKWFLASKIGATAWAIPSEQYYATNRASYYEYIHIGPNYYTLKLERCIPFLLMLPKAMNSKDKGQSE